MKFIFLLLLICSCSSVGPNYNVGKTHNEDKANRKQVVLKEDKNMKKKMSKERKRASSNKVRIKKSRNRKMIR